MTSTQLEAAVNTAKAELGVFNNEDGRTQRRTVPGERKNGLEREERRTHKERGIERDKGIVKTPQ